MSGVIERFLNNIFPRLVYYFYGNGLTGNKFLMKTHLRITKNAVHAHDDK